MTRIISATIIGKAGCTEVDKVIDFIHIFNLVESWESVKWIFKVKIVSCGFSLPNESA